MHYIKAIVSRMLGRRKQMEAPYQPETRVILVNRPDGTVSILAVS